MARDVAARGVAAQPHDATGLTRRRLLQAATAGAAGAALPLVDDGRVDAAGRQLPKYLRNGRFGIGVHWTRSIGADTEQFAALADSGLNLLLSVPGEDASAGRQVLDLAHQYKLRCVVGSGELTRLATRPGAALPPRTEWAGLSAGAIEPFAAHPAVVGFHLDDATRADLFGRQAYLVDLLRSKAPELLSLIGLLPADASPARLRAADYADYLHQFAQVGVPVVSAGPVSMPVDGASEAAIFATWAVAREDARRRAVPLWGTLQNAWSQSHRPSPLRELLWQANVALTYGATALSFAGDLIGEDPATIRSVNRDWLQPVGDELAMMRSESVQHTGEASGDRFRPDGWVGAVEGSPVIVGSFTSRLRRDRRWLLLVNRRRDEAAAVTMRFGAGVHRVARFDPAEEEYKPVPGQAAAGRNSLRFVLRPGTAVLLRMSRGR
jgi:hypothetical protein